MSPFLIPIVGIVAGTLMALGFPLVRAYARKLELEGQQPRIPQEVADRLARMEQAIDTIAVEVERITEAQRFTARLLAERAESQASLTAGPSATP
jgi:HPt (histidine-containing phosphotransfer) domain-containing protein